MIQLRLILIAVLACSSYFALAQKEGINQFDSLGKKHGNWIVYLDYYWKDVKDSSQALYYRYNYYDHGTSTGTFGYRGKKGWKCEPLEDTVGQVGKPKLLDGEYKSYDEKGNLRIVQELKDGEGVFYQSYEKNGKPDLYIDYRKKYNNEANSYTVYQYKKNGDIRYYAGHKGRVGWALYADYSDSATVDTLKTVGDSIFITRNDYMRGKLFYQNDLVFIPTADNPDRRILHGHSSSCYRNGQKRAEGQYRYGKKTGHWNYWKRNGKEMKPHIFNFLQRNWYPEF